VFKTLRHWIEEKSGHFESSDPGQFLRDTAPPPVIRLKLGAEMSCGRSVRLPNKAIVNVCGVFRNLKGGAFQVYIFKKCSNFSVIFIFTLNVTTTKTSPPKGKGDEDRQKAP